MLLQSCKAWSGRHGAYLKEALKQGWQCVESWLWMRVSLLNIPRYIFIVQRLSILSKLDYNNPYLIWAELYFSNLNYLIILDTWPIWPSRRPHKSRCISWSYLSFGPILFAVHLLVWPSYGDNTCPFGFGNNNSETTFSGFRCLASSIFESEHACHFHLCGSWLLDICLFGNRHGVDSYPLQPLFNLASTHRASISFLKLIATASSPLPSFRHGLLILQLLQFFHCIRE
jgi:hypothetical protein